MGTKSCKPRARENRTGLGGDKNEGQGGRVLAVARQEAGSEGGSAGGEIARGVPLW